MEEARREALKIYYYPVVIDEHGKAVKDSGVECVKEKKEEKKEERINKKQLIFIINNEDELTGAVLDEAEQYGCVMVVVRVDMNSSVKRRKTSDDTEEQNNNNNTVSPVTPAVASVSTLATGVLIIGGWNNGSTEVYLSGSNRVFKGPEMIYPRRNHASVALPTGDVAVFGGRMGKPEQMVFSSSCEVFFVKENEFSRVGSMHEERESPAAVLLRDGLVMVIGGSNEKVLDSCELYHPKDKVCVKMDIKLCLARYAHTATLLADGTVLVCGGSNDMETDLQTTEIYHPSAGMFTAGPPMLFRHSYHTATALPNGTVLISGGVANGSSVCTEIFDPLTRTFTAGPPMAHARICHFASLLPNGKVLIGGGLTHSSEKTTELYDPATNSFVKGIDLLGARNRASAAPIGQLD